MDVSTSELSSDELVGCFLDRPRPSNREDGGGAAYDIEIEGWAAGRRLAVVSVEAVRDGVAIWRVLTDADSSDVADTFPEAPSGRSCFRASVSALNFPLEFEFAVRVVLEDRTAVEIATVRGRRAPLRSEFEPRLQPLMITTTGRTGSTALVHLLSAHPEIVAYRPFEYEPRVAGYWLNVLRALSEPESFLRQVHGGFAANPRHTWRWLGRDGGVATTPDARVPILPKLVDRDIQDWMGADGVYAAIDFCHRRIDAFYAQVARHFEKSNAVYFAERYAPRSLVPSMLSEIYPGTCEVMLVRDFRDVVCSMLAWNVKVGAKGFGERADNDREFISRDMANATAALMRSWEEKADRAHLVRYEDLILHPEETVERLLAYLGLDSRAETVRTMTRSLERRDTDGHRTSVNPEASIGRWRHELSAELQELCETTFGPALETFGYPVEARCKPRA